MNPTYRIRDWSKHFENNRTRELKELRFVIISNKQDGDGYTELLDHPNGAAHYGAWVSITQVASKGQHPAGGCGISAGCCECRGILLREGARPHDAASLSRLTRIPASVFEEVLPRLVDIGWLDSSLAEPAQIQPDSEIPRGGAETRASQSRRGVRKSAASIEGNGTEQNGIEQKEKPGLALPPFNGEEFLLVLSSFETHRKEMKKPLHATGRKQLYAQLADMGEEKSIAALKKSIASGWQGVFEPSGNGGYVSQAEMNSASKRTLVI